MIVISSRVRVRSRESGVVKCHTQLTSKTTLLLPRAIAGTRITPNLISSQTHQHGNHQPETPRDELCILCEHH